MTDEQKRKIEFLRYQGWGYDRIANSLGASRDTVRGYCKRKGINGLATDLTIMHQKLKEEFAYEFCLYCGLTLCQGGKGRKKKYCSIKCKREWEKTNRKIYILHCEYCGKEYKSLGVKDRKYCSHDCYIRDRFWRQEDATKIIERILENKRVEYLPKWLKDLLLSSTEG